MSLIATRPCPICSRPAESGARPFCSSRCRDVDLQRWFSGTYAIPGDELEDEDAGETGQYRSPPL